MTSELKLSFRFIDKRTRLIASKYFEALNSPVSLGLYLCLKYGDDVSSCSHEIDPRQYEDVESFRPDYLAANFLSKYCDGPSSLENERNEKALVKFWCCEEQLKASYEGFQRILSGPSSSVQRVLFLARERIASVLGDLRTAFDIDSCSFGPGSSSSIPRRRAHPSNKYLSADVSSGCAPYVSWFYSGTQFPLPLLNRVEHSRVEFVPKSFKINRIIAVEPDWNIFFQKGVGVAIRQRLRKFGIDLDHGAQKHASWALTSSLSGRYATIDMSSASDCISTQLIRFLLPDQWFFFLNSIRVDRIFVEDHVYPLRKFSSMGNGFTFELESLVFSALAYAVCREEQVRPEVLVFGDDIIINTNCVELFTDTVRTCGFSLNMRKSFSTGYFRESCGAHYFKGVDVKPIYLKHAVTHDMDCFRLCNQLHRLSYRTHSVGISSTYLNIPYRYIESQIRKVFRIPDGYGDGGLISTLDEAVPPRSFYKGKDKRVNIRKMKHCIEGYSVPCLIPIGKIGSCETAGMYLYKLRSQMLRRTSVWHKDGIPIFRVSLSDLRLADIKPICGNEYLVPLPGKAQYRVGRMHIVEWFNPGSIIPDPTSVQ